MTQPLVCCVMLTAIRPQYARRAVENFRRQTYTPRTLLVFDTSGDFAGFEVGPETEGNSPETPESDRGYLLYENYNELRSKTIGELRNAVNANTLAREADILIHWDDDDYSHPNRIAEQVALLQSSGADVVGYREMLFWREPVYEQVMALQTKDGGWTKESLASFGVPWPPPAGWLDKMRGEAWLYSCANPNYALGTSLCYWRHVWERKPFEATSIGEDERFLRGLKVAAVSSLEKGRYEATRALSATSLPPSYDHLVAVNPRMIARIHAGNTSTAYSPRKMEAEARKKTPMWKRTPEWDSYCAETMR